MDLTDCRTLTNDVLKQLQTLPDLRRLVIIRTGIDENGFQTLQQFTQLRELHLGYRPRNYEKGIATLRKALPNCRVYAEHDYPV